ncbi:TetR/AcrR family transcriptional regulator [Gordonia soli]|uniref:Putative TetR family transcriptional regulator n=1 Tax=Gordonia soli NBRC 108243 TaxID=1223545 RepID=M0QR20_9ACTN|nr:TetR/AcrR family transcriptional regulator [Gordonia soli]GAC69857.1 putative TetR family transcriptional regulator [Gordonia soli NBRC 108243]
MASVVRPYRGVSAEDRTRERRERLIDASLDVVSESGIAAATVEAIAGHAGLSKRYFYESFRDRDEILVAALDSVFEPMGARLRSALADGGSTDDRVAVTAATLVHTLADDPRATRLFLAAPGSAALEARRRHLVDEFTPALMRDVLDADPDDARRMMATTLMVAGTTEVLDRWLRGDLPLSREEFTDTLAMLGRRLAAAPD